METFGLILSLPGAFCASLVYCCLLVFVVQYRWPRIVPLLQVGSILTLLLFTAEAGWLMAVGVVRSRILLGPGFYFVHRLCFFLGVPALANLLVLSKRKSILSRWYTAPFACALFGFCLVLVEYAVYEGLYGVDGIGGPFGTPLVSETRRQRQTGPHYTTLLTSGRLARIAHAQRSSDQQPPPHLANA